MLPEDRILSGEALAELPQNRPIVLHCKTGVRAAEALAALEQASITGVTPPTHTGRNIACAKQTALFPSTKLPASPRFHALYLLAEITARWGPSRPSWPTCTAFPMSPASNSRRLRSPTIAPPRRRGIGCVDPRVAAEDRNGPPGCPACSVPANGWAFPVTDHTTLCDLHHCIVRVIRSARSIRQQSMHRPGRSGLGPRPEPAVSRAIPLYRRAYSARWPQWLLVHVATPSGVAVPPDGMSVWAYCWRDGAGAAVRQQVAGGVRPVRRWRCAGVIVVLCSSSGRAVAPMLTRVRISLGML